MRNLKCIKEQLLQMDIVMMIIVIVLVLMSQIIMLQILFSGEKYTIRENLQKMTLWSIGYWSGKEGDISDGISRWASFEEKTQELSIGIGGKYINLKLILWSVLLK